MASASNNEPTKDVEKYFSDILKNDTNLSAGIAAIKTLLMVLKETDFATIQELHSEVQKAVKIMRHTDIPITAVISSSELFSRFITLGKFDDKPMEECKQIMLHRGHVFLRKLLETRNIIAKRGSKCIQDGCRVLTHSRSRVVLETLMVAASQNKHFHVYVTQSSLDNHGVKMCEDLENAGIECTLILDASICYIMETIDLVMVGAEGVVMSGGIINRIGTVTMAVCAHVMKKPFYVCAESFKFSQMFPLNQMDLPDDYKYKRNLTGADGGAAAATAAGGRQKAHPLVDYTPPAYITLFFTDLGTLPPSAVCDELIKLYL